MAWLPPTGIGQPTVWARVASIRPAPAETNDGIVEIVWAATPVKSARASSPRSRPHAGLPWASTRRPARTVVARSGGRDRLSREKNPTPPPRGFAGGPKGAPHAGPTPGRGRVRPRPGNPTPAGRP